MPDSTAGSIDVVPVAEVRELPALLTALKALLEHFGPDEVVVLSPFGEQSSLVGRFLAREPANKEERQLRDLLSGERAVAWRSIFKGKGLDAAAVVLTDITPDAAAWADERRLSWNDLLYVGMTRAQYGCTVLRSEGAPWSGELDAELGAARVPEGAWSVGGAQRKGRGRDGRHDDARALSVFPVSILMRGPKPSSIIWISVRDSLPRGHWRKAYPRFSGTCCAR